VRQLCQTGILLETGKVKFCGRAADAIEAYNGVIDTACEVTFRPKCGRPSITSVKINPEALARGDLDIEISFQSPFPLNPPVPGFVMYSTTGVPVFASNPRFHRADYSPSSASSGVVTFTARKLPICGGRYRLSIWLGDWHTDYDYQADILAFDFKHGETSLNRPDPDSVGYVDSDGLWKVKESEVWQQSGGA